MEKRTEAVGRAQYVEVPVSPLAPGISPVRIRYGDCGNGAPLVFLHSGWGYQIYPFDLQAGAIGGRCRIITPDRSGYGGSTPVTRLETDFHRRAVTETLAVLDALGVERAVWWGHSDGAVIALLAGLQHPDRVAGIVAEATHYERAKPASRAFFESIRDDPEGVGERVAAVLARDHGPRWPRVIAMHSDVWRRIAVEAGPTPDFYDGRLAELAVPTLVLHGARDPRTEPGELDELRAVLPRARFAVLEEGGHSPHSERATAAAVGASAASFLDRCGYLSGE